MDSDGRFFITSNLAVPAARFRELGDDWPEGAAVDAELRVKPNLESALSASSEELPAV